MQFETRARTTLFLYQNPSGHHLGFETYTNPFSCHIQPISWEEKLFAPLIATPNGDCANEKTKDGGVEGNSSRESIMLVYCNRNSDCNNMILHEHYASNMFYCSFYSALLLDKVSSFTSGGGLYDHPPPPPLPPPPLLLPPPPLLLLLDPTSPKFAIPMRLGPKVMVLQSFATLRVITYMLLNANACGP
jgi:hypothetical protein